MRSIFSSLYFAPKGIQYLHIPSKEIALICPAPRTRAKLSYSSRNSSSFFTSFTGQRETFSEDAGVQSGDDHSDFGIIFKPMPKTALGSTRKFLTSSHSFALLCARILSKVVASLAASFSWIHKHAAQNKCTKLTKLPHFKKIDPTTATLIQSGRLCFNRRGASTPLWGVQACSPPSVPNRLTF